MRRRLPLLTSRAASNEGIFVTKTSDLALVKRFDTKFPRRATFGHVGTKPGKLRGLELAQQQQLKELDHDYPAEVRPNSGRWRPRPRFPRAPHRGLGRARPRHGWSGTAFLVRRQDDALQRPARRSRLRSWLAWAWGCRHARQEARRDGDRDRHPRQSARCVARFHRRAAGHGEAAIRTQRLDFRQRRQGAVRACATSRRQRDRPRQERPRFVEGGRCAAHQAHTRAAHQGDRAPSPVPRESPLWAATRLPPVTRSWRQT